MTAVAAVDMSVGRVVWVIRVQLVSTTFGPLLFRGRYISSSLNSIFSGLAACIIARLLAGAEGVSERWEVVWGRCSLKHLLYQRLVGGGISKLAFLSPQCVGGPALRKHEICCRCNIGFVPDGAS